MSWLAPLRALDREDCLDDAIRSEVLLVLKLEKFGKACAGAVHPALDGADLRPTNLHDLLIAQSLRAMEEKNLALLWRKFCEGHTEVSQIEAAMLFRQR